MMIAIVIVIAGAWPGSRRVVRDGHAPGRRAEVHQGLGAPQSSVRQQSPCILEP